MKSCTEKQRVYMRLQAASACLRHCNEMVRRSMAQLTRVYESCYINPFFMLTECLSKAVTIGFIMYTLAKF